MLDDVTKALRCPLCRAGLARDGGVLRCEAGHAFDLARQGYVTLLAAQTPHAGDTAEMVAAREEFLAAGHYAPIAAAVAELCAAAELPAGRLLELGAGTGYYLAAALEALPGRSGIAIELSRPAAQRAARAHPRIGAVRCDIWGGLPVRDASVAAALSVFAPRNAAELERVVTPGGVLAVATPASDHLAELAGPLELIGIEADKERRLEGKLISAFELTERRPLRLSLELSRSDAAALVAMGPSAHHLDPDVLASRIAAMPEPVAATASFELSLYRRRL
ncbi:MAG: putative RNA methyltransferase [Solirubrobacterales bacterium]